MGMLIYNGFVWSAVTFAALWVASVLLVYVDQKWPKLRTWGYDRDVRALWLANRTHNIERLGGEKEYNNVIYRRAMCMGVLWAAVGTVLLFIVYTFTNWLVFA